MNISVVIPAFRDIADVLTCLNSLQATSSNFQQIQWVLQDDCSPNLDMRMLVPPYMASVERNEVNLGFAANCNRGAARATGDIIVFANQDIVASNLSVGWDTVIRAAFDDASVGIVAPRLLFPDGKVQSVGGGFDNHLQPYHRCLGYSNLDYWEVNTPQEVAWVTGAYLAIRREIFQQVGGFDETYISYFEDCDLCIRVKEAGYKVVIDPRVSFTHKVGSTGGSPHFMNSAMTFKKRYVDTRKLIADVPVVLERWW